MMKLMWPTGRCKTGLFLLALLVSLPVWAQPSEAQRAEWRAKRAAASAGNVERPRGDALLWFSDFSPSRRGRPGMMMMMGDAVPVKKLWLFQGGDPSTAQGVQAGETSLLLDPEQKQTELAVEADEGPYSVSFPMPVPGYYNSYFVRQTVEDAVLKVVVAKAETPRSLGRSTEEEKDRLMLPRTDSRVPVEILRQRKEKEGLSTRVTHGDLLSFQVLKAGQPVRGARVTLTSGQGWSKTLPSDEQGRAAFTLIRDYYPPWEAFDKRYRDTYLVSAVFSDDAAGDFQGKAYRSARYTTTLSGAYYPSTEAYRSYGYGLLIGFAALLLAGAGVYGYRRRRLQPFQEVRFDEKS